MIFHMIQNVFHSIFKNRTKLQKNNQFPWNGFQLKKKKKIWSKTFYAKTNKALNQFFNGRIREFGGRGRGRWGGQVKYIRNFKMHWIINIYIYKTETFEAPTNFHVSIILKNKNQYIYIYKTETFEAPTNFHVSIILKNKKIKNVIKL